MLDTSGQNRARVYVLVKVQPGAIEEFVKQASHLDGITRVSPVTGSYDVVVIVDEEDHAKALRIVLKGLLSLPGVAGTETLVEVTLE